MYIYVGMCVNGKQRRTTDKITITYREASRQSIMKVFNEPIDAFNQHHL